MGKEIKVIDKRMFTPEGELREEYRSTGEEGKREPEPAPPREDAPREQAPPPQSRREPPAGAGGRLEIPDMGPSGNRPSFLDLVALLAEPVPVYLGDAKLPGGGSAEDPEMARLHIDLLDVLRQKTLGNLSAQESAFLEDLLYRLRLRFVQKRG